MLIGARHIFYVHAMYAKRLIVAKSWKMRQKAREFPEENYIHKHLIKANWTGQFRSPAELKKQIKRKK